MLQSELLDFIREHKKEGTPSWIIHHDLLQAGWKERDIKKAFVATSSAPVRVTRLLTSFTLKLLVLGFAASGAVLLGTHFAVYFHLTDTAGIVDTQSDTFWQQAAIVHGATPDQAEDATTSFFQAGTYCVLGTLKDNYPAEYQRILTMALGGQETQAQKVLEAVTSSLFAPAIKKDIDDCMRDNPSSPVAREKFERLAYLISDESPFAWANSKEWKYFRSTVVKDKDLVYRIENMTGVPGRVLVSELAAEQMRLFYSDRGWYEKVISPLKVLGSMTQFSWGILGIKPETAMRIEQNLKDKTSPYYLGPEYEHMLDFKTTDIEGERFARITANRDHYYAYLYAALYNKQIVHQWEAAGYDIKDRPEILATLYNIGFYHSRPNANPEMGGAELTIDGHVISFGRLAYEFYYSNELLEDFPFQQ